MQKTFPIKTRVVFIISTKNNDDRALAQQAESRYLVMLLI